MENGWREIDSDMPYWEDIRAKYRDGTETIGQFYQHDQGSEWWDKQSPDWTDWPQWWAPLPSPPSTHRE